MNLAGREIGFVARGAGREADRRQCDNE